MVDTVIAGFMTGGALAVRGGWKAARNSAITCGCLLAVIEGVGIGFSRLMAENTRLDVCVFVATVLKTDDRAMANFRSTGTTTCVTSRRKFVTDDCVKPSIHFLMPVHSIIRPSYLHSI